MQVNLKRSSQLVGRLEPPSLPLPWLFGEGKLGDLLRVARPDGDDSDDISWANQKNHVSPHSVSHERVFQSLSLL